MSRDRVDDHRLQVMRGGAWADLSTGAGDVQLVDEMNTLSVELTFSLADNPLDRYALNSGVAVGDRVRVVNGQNLTFSGVVTSGDLTHRFTAHDFGWYLGKSEMVYQCTGMRADAAIRQLCGRGRIDVGNIPSMAVSITQIWVGNTFAQILEDIIETVTTQTGRKYLYRVEGGKFWLRELPNDVTTLMHRPTDNVRAFDPTWTLGDVAGGFDISSDFANAVVLAQSESETAYVLARAENAASIAKYGRIQKTLTVSQDMTGIPVEIAAKALQESDRLSGSFTVNLLGDDNAKSGRVIRLSSAKFGLNGLYRIESVTHSYGRPYEMELTLVPASVGRAAGAADTVTGSTVPITHEEETSTSTKKDTSGSSYAVGESTPSTGTGTRDAFLQKVQGEVGVAESPIGSNQQKYGRWFGMNGVSWCAIFVSWCASHAGVPKSVMPHTYSSVSQFLEWGKAQGIYRAKGSGFIPRPGDLMIQKNNASHIGIVVAATGAQFSTVEGNSSNRVSRRTYRYNDSKLSGFCAIKWGG